MTLHGFNLEQRPFDLALQSDLTLTDPVSFPQGPVSVGLGLSARMSLDHAFSRFELVFSEFDVDIHSDAGASALTASLTLSAQDLLGELSYRGQLDIAPVNLKAVLVSLGQTPPPTARPEALTSLGLSAELAGDSHSAALNKLAVTLDSTSFKGRLALTDIASQSVVLEMAGDRLNVDDYLPPASDQAAEAAPGAEGERTASVGVEEPLPLGGAARFKSAGTTDTAGAKGQPADHDRSAPQCQGLRTACWP